MTPRTIESSPPPPVYLHLHLHNQDGSYQFSECEKFRIEISQGGTKPIPPEKEATEPKTLSLRYRIDPTSAAVRVTITDAGGKKTLDFDGVNLTQRQESVLSLRIAELDSSACAAVPGRLIAVIDAHRADGVPDDQIVSSFAGYDEFCIRHLRESPDARIQANLAELLDRLDPPVPMAFLDDCHVLVVPPSTGPHTVQFAPPPHDSAPPRTWDGSTNDLWCLAACDGTGTLCCADDCEVKFPDSSVRSFVGRIWALAIDAANNRLAVGGMNGVVVIYDRVGDDWRSSDTVYVGPSAVQALAFSPVSSRLGIATLDGQGHLYDFAIRSMQGSGLKLSASAREAGAVPTAIAITRDARWVAVAAGLRGAGEVSLYEVGKGQNPKRTHPTGRVHAMRFRQTDDPNAVELLVASVTSDQGTQQVVVEVLELCDAGEVPPRELRRFPLST